MVDGPGEIYSKSPADIAEYMHRRDISSEYKIQVYQLGDYLRIAATGAKILGAPGEGGGIRGALTAASKPLAELGVGLGESIDTRRSKATERRQAKVRDIAELDTGIMLQQNKI